MRLLALALALVAAGCAPASVVLAPVGTLDEVNARLASRDAVVVLSQDFDGLRSEAADVVVGRDSTRWAGPDGPVAFATSDVARVEVFGRGAKRAGAFAGAAVAAALTLAAVSRASPDNQLHTADDAIGGIPLGALVGYALGSHVYPDRRVFVYVGPVSRYPGR